MPSKKQVRRSYAAILNKVGLTPDDIPLYFPAEWKRETGHNFGRYFGRATTNPPRIGLGMIRVLALEQVKETIWHELGHILFPSRPHWWIECYGEKMARTGNGDNRYSTRYAHTPEDLPSRVRLLELSRSAAKRRFLDHRRE